MESKLCDLCVTTYIYRAFGSAPASYTSPKGRKFDP